MQEFPPRDELFQSPEEWKSLFGEAPCGYLLTDPKGRIHLVNDTLLGWLKYPRKEVESKMRFQDLLPPGENIFYESRHAIMLKLQQQVNELNYNLIDKDGNRRPVLVNSARRLNKEGELVALQFVILLFTDRKKYEQELLNAKKRAEEAAAAKSNFLSIVSHEVRTPIHAILNSIEILIQDNFTTAQRELLEVIHHASNNLLGFVNSVLNITKMEAGNMVEIKAPFNLEYLLNQSLVIFQSLAQKKDIDFIVTIAEDIPKTVIGDQNSIRQILTNLIGNAIKFTQKGRVELNVNAIAVDAETCRLQFALMDTGIGMSGEELKNIFEPFTQANPSIHQQYGGTGLGLSISKHILQLLRSEMKVESELGKGSTFTFELEMPVSKEPVRKDKSFKGPEQPEQFAHLKVLLVDDVYSNILMIKRYFNKWNVSFEYVLSGSDAITKIQEQDFDLVLMDISMPEMDGYETTKGIRSLEGEKFQRVPIIAVSAFEVSEIKYKAKRSGMNGILPKPFKAVQLYETILKWTPAEKTTPDFSSEKKQLANKKPATDYLSLRNVCNLFDQDTMAIKDYLKNVITELEVTIEEFTTAKEQHSLEAYLSVVHKNISNVSMFDLQILKEKMAEGERLLKSGKKEIFVEQCNDIITSFQAFKNWIQKKINEKGALCED